MNKIFFIFWFLLFTTTYLKAQLHFNATSGALVNGMAGIGVNSTGVDAIFNNQAGIISNKKISYILTSELRNDIPDLIAVGAGMTIPLKNLGVFGLSASNLGLADYKEQKIGLAYAKSLFHNFDMGVQLDLLNTSILNFGNRITGTFELGFIAHIGSKFNIAGHIFSPIVVSITNQNNDVNARLRLGGSYQPTSKANVFLELDKWYQNDLSIKGGFAYQIVDKISIRMGMSTKPSIYSIGLSYNLFQNISIDGAYSTHPTLGGTPSIAIKNNRE